MRPPGGGTRLAGPVLASLLCLGVVLLAWVLFLRLFAVSPLIGKSPADVWHYLFTSSVSSHNRAALLAALLVTLLHAGIGFAAGFLAALAASVLLVLAPLLEGLLLPPMMILRAMPLVAMTPLIVLLFGRGLYAIAVLGALVVFFPSVVLITLGLGSAPRAAVDLLRAHGGGAGSVLLKVRLPWALPAILAAAALSAPAALVGALLAEWLASGDGLGNRLQTDITSFRASDLWSGIVLLTACSLVITGALGLLRRIVVGRLLLDD